MVEMVELLKQTIVQAVNEAQGVKLGDLTSMITTKSGADPNVVTKVIHVLVSSGDLGEIRYVVPDEPYKQQSFIVPAGTEISTHGSVEIPFP